MEIDKSIKVGDIVATNASNIRPYIGQRVFGEVSRINFTGIHKGFLVALNLNGKLFNNYTSMNVCPFNEPGRPYEDAYLVKATPEECEAHRTGVMPSKEDLWCIQVTEGNIDLLNEYMQPLLEKYCKPNTWEITKSTLGFYFTCPDKWTGQHSYQAPLSETKLITTEEFIEKTGMKKKSEFKYKKGVWYKIEKRDSFGKCNKDSNDNIPYDECIVEKQYEIHNGLVAHLDGIEADMNEVSKYLPDGHPDKVRPHSFEGRYLKCLNDRGKKHYPCHTGDYLKFVAEKNGIQYWGAYNSKCQSDGTDNPRYFASNVHENKYFELMPVGFEPNSERSLKASEEYLPLEESKYHVEPDKLKSYYNLGCDPVEEPKIVIPRKDTFDPIVKAPIVI